MRSSDTFLKLPIPMPTSGPSPGVRGQKNQKDLRALAGRPIHRNSTGDEQRIPRDDHTLHEDSDANDYTSMGCVVCTGMCIYPHKSGRQDGY